MNPEQTQQIDPSTMTSEQLKSVIIQLYTELGQLAVMQNQKAGAAGQLSAIYQEKLKAEQAAIKTPINLPKLRRIAPPGQTAEPEKV